MQSNRTLRAQGGEILGQAAAILSLGVFLPFQLIRPWTSFEREQVIRQCWVVLGEGAFVILLALAVLSGVLILELSYHLKLVVQQDNLVPPFSYLLLARELLPVVVAFLLTARSGASMASELGIMAQSEQLDSLHIFGVSWVRFLVLPRVVASCVAHVFLGALGLVIALLSSALASSVFGLRSMAEYLQFVFLMAEPKDLMELFSKSIAFGYTMPIIACALGAQCRGGSEGVGKVTHQSVTLQSIMIILMDFVLTFLFFARS